MNQEKSIGMDVHQATISVAVMDAGGKLIMECLLETKPNSSGPSGPSNSATSLRACAGSTGSNLRLQKKRYWHWSQRAESCRPRGLRSPLT